MPRRLFGAAVVLGGALLAQPATAQTALSPQAMTDQITECFRAEDYQRAIELIDDYLAERPEDPVLLYNAACAHARLGGADAATAHLLNAVKAGFLKFSHIKRDPDLASVREHPRYRAIIAAREAADPLLAQRRIDTWMERLDKNRYSVHRYDERRTAFVSTLDERRQGDIDQSCAQYEQTLGNTLFGNVERPHLVVILPAADDELLGDPHAHGHYNHDRQELIARDTDRALRHELVHVLHHHHMDRIGQAHPMWIQEGLAALHEGCEIKPDGALRFVPNERRNVAKTLARRGRLLDWPVMFELSDGAFLRRRTELYAQSQSIFEFLSAHHDIGEWYRLYIEHYESDSTGTMAMEKMFDLPIAEIERRWQAWLAMAPAIVVRGDVPSPAPDPS